MMKLKVKSQKLKSVNRYIKKRLMREGLSMKKLSERTGLSYITVMNIVNKMEGNISTLEKIVSYLSQFNRDWIYSDHVNLYDGKPKLTLDGSVINFKDGEYEASEVKDCLMLVNPVNGKCLKIDMDYAFAENGTDYKILGSKLKEIRRNK